MVSGQPPTVQPREVVVLVYGISETTSDLDDIVILAQGDTHEVPHANTATSSEGHRERPTSTASRILKEMHISIKTDVRFHSLGVYTNTSTGAVVHYFGIPITSCVYPGDLNLKWLSYSDLNTTRGERGREAAIKLRDLCAQLRIPIERLSLMSESTLLPTSLRLVIHKGSGHFLFTDDNGYEFPTEKVLPGQTIKEVCAGLVTKLGGRLRDYTTPVHLENLDSIRLINAEHRHIRYAALDASAIKGKLRGIYMHAEMVRANFINSPSMFANSYVDTGVVDAVIMLGNRDIQADDSSSIESAQEAETLAAAEFGP